MNQFKEIRKAAHISTEILQQLVDMVEIGVSLKEIDNRAFELIDDFGVSSAFIGVDNGKSVYRHATCIGLNDDVVHGIPNKRQIHSGDLVTIDFGIVSADGWYTDHCHTVGVGEVSTEDRKLLETAKLAISSTAQAVKPGMRVGDLGHRLEGIVSLAGFSVVKEFVGHAIGKKLHLAPEIPAYGEPETGPKLEPGMVITVEAQINAGSDNIETAMDGWSVVTVDGENSAMFEYMVAITQTGSEILTPTVDWPVLK